MTSINQEIPYSKYTSGVVDRLIKSEDGVESFWKKVIRHVLKGDLHPQTLLRGADSFLLYLASRGNEASFGLSEVVQDFEGKIGATLYRYAITRERGNYSALTGEAVVVEFPRSSEIKTKECSSAQEASYGLHISQPEYITRVSGAYAAFIGPTRESYFPNNGYFSEEKGLQVLFMDTNPPGKRRGAIAFTNKGEFEILNEAARIRARENNFAEYTLVAGTSFYLLSTDPVDGIELFASLDRTKVSYIISFVNRQGEEQFAHVSFVTLVNRQEVKMLLDKHSKQQTWQSYIAAELEYEHGGCVFLNQQKEDALTKATSGSSTVLGSHRFDHYYVCDGSETH